MNIDGTCLCGQIKFEANVDPETTTICHCTDCQINSGTAFGYVVGAINDSFNLLKGELSFYIKLADSGAKRELAFCGKCGTRIYAKPENGKPGFFGLRVGTIRQRKTLQPKRQAWKKSCLLYTSPSPRDATLYRMPSSA